MRNIQRTVVLVGLLLLGGLFGLLGTGSVFAGSTTMEITDVFNATSAKDENFQIYNISNKPLSTEGYSICTSSVCIKLATTLIQPFSLLKINASTLTTWPTGGLDGASDMLGLLDNKNVAVDVVNWGTPDPGWKQYATFKEMLFNPGIKVADAKGNQSFFRAAISNDTDKVTDWLVTVAEPPAGPTATAVPAGTPKPAATKTPTSGIQVQTNPTTGGEFPLFLIAALVIAVLGVRYLRVRRNPLSR